MKSVRGSKTSRYWVSNCAADDGGVFPLQNNFAFIGSIKSFRELTSFRFTSNKSICKCSTYIVELL